MDYRAIKEMREAGEVPTPAQFDQAVAAEEETLFDIVSAIVRHSGRCYFHATKNPDPSTNSDLLTEIQAGLQTTSAYEEIYTRLSKLHYWAMKADDEKAPLSEVEIPSFLPEDFDV